MKKVLGQKIRDASVRDNADVEQWDAAKGGGVPGVMLTTYDGNSNTATSSAWSPKQARKLAIALIEAAAEAEGRA